MASVKLRDQFPAFNDSPKGELLHSCVEHTIPDKFTYRSDMGIVHTVHHTCHFVEVKRGSQRSLIDQCKGTSQGFTYHSYAEVHFLVVYFQLKIMMFHIDSQLQMTNRTITIFPVGLFSFNTLQLLPMHSVKIISIIRIIQLPLTELPEI